MTLLVYLPVYNLKNNTFFSFCLVIIQINTNLNLVGLLSVSSCVNNLFFIQFYGVRTDKTFFRYFYYFRLFFRLPKAKQPLFSCVCKSVCVCSWVREKKEVSSHSTNQIESPRDTNQWAFTISWTTLGETISTLSLCVHTHTRSHTTSKVKGALSVMHETVTETEDTEKNRQTI